MSLSPAHATDDRRLDTLKLEILLFSVDGQRDDEEAERQRRYGSSHVLNGFVYSIRIGER
ncbi:MAG: hypothetical protein C4334_01465 [Pyrinomonas sp.]